MPKNGGSGKLNVFEAVDRGRGEVILRRNHIAGIAKRSAVLSSILKTKPARAASANFGGSHMPGWLLLVNSQAPVKWRNIGIHHIMPVAMEVHYRARIDRPHRIPRHLVRIPKRTSRHI